MASDDVGQLLALKLMQIQLFLVIFIPDTGASYCTEEQITNCKQSARDGTLAKLAGGGECQVKRYVQFTHLCTVNNYVPSTEYCCCAQDRKTFCCRYHYDWNYFRCAESEDIIDTLPDSALPQELLLTAILVPTAAALCCIICCIRCLCCRYDEEDNWSCSKCKICSKQETSETYTVGQRVRPDDVEMPLKKPHDTKRPLPDNSYDEFRGDTLTSSTTSHPGATPPVPSAPPLEDIVQFNPRPMCTSGPSGSSGVLVHYILTAPPNDGMLMECPQHELTANQRADNPYHVTAERFADSPNCYYGIPSNPDGTPIIPEHTSAPSSDLPYSSGC